MNHNSWSLFVRWGRRLFGRRGSSAAATPSARRPRLNVELLEDRTLPSVTGPAPQLAISIGESEAGQVAVALATSQGRPIALSYLPQSIQAAELNGDNQLDLIVTNPATSERVFLLSRGDGTFDAVSEPVDVGLPAHAFVTAEEPASQPMGTPVAGIGLRRAKSLADGPLALPPIAAPALDINLLGADGGRSTAEGTRTPLALGRINRDDEGNDTQSSTGDGAAALAFAPLPVASAYLLSLGSRKEVPDLLPLQDTTLGVVGTILSVRREHNAAEERTDPGGPVAGRMAEAEPAPASAVLSRFVTGQEEALKNRPPLTREELLGPAGQSSPDTEGPAPLPVPDSAVVPPGSGI